VGRLSQIKIHVATNLLLLLAVAVPLSCLAFLSWLALLGVMALGAVINAIGIVRAVGRNGFVSNQRTARSDKPTRSRDAMTDEER
jgi:hypothetical protein